MDWDIAKSLACSMLSIHSSGVERVGSDVEDGVELSLSLSLSFSFSLSFVEELGFRSSKV